jgi:signal transduction histidine kinase
MQQADMVVVLGRMIATHIERDREIASRRAAEAEQARLYQLAQDAIREREALLAIASHELKTPLTAVVGYAYLLQRRLRGAPQASERDLRTVDTMVAQATRLDRMLTDLLDLSRLERGEVPHAQRPVDLATLVHAVVEEAHPTPTEHTVTIMGGDGPIMVAGDADQLAQVLRNLLSNAIKYSPGGGQVRIALATDGAHARVSVEDNGIGIPADALPHVFQRFYRVRNDVGQAIEGFGIGLYVVQEIVTRHGGTITVASTEGAGATFTVCLPALADPRAG